MNTVRYHHRHLSVRWLSFWIITAALLAGASSAHAQVPDSGRCTPPPSGMIAWWSLDETGLTPGMRVVDLTGSPLTYYPPNTPSHDGWVVGNLTAGQGKVAGGFHFSNDRTKYVRVEGDPVLNMGRGDLSIDAWVRLDNEQINGVIVDKRDAIGNVRGYSFFIYGNHPGIQLADDSSGWYNWVAYNAVMQPGRWYLMAVTVDRDSPTGGKLYLDGSVVLTFDPRNRMGSLDNAGDLYIGKSDINASAPFSGNIDEVELFKRVLGPDEIKLIYAAGSNGKCKNAVQPPVDSGRCTPAPGGMIAWWPLDETRLAPGMTVVDLTGNPAAYSPANAANNGAVVGALTAVPGKVAGAFHFLGDGNQYVRVPDHPELDMGRGDLSIDAWVRMDRSSTYGVIVDKRDGVGNVRGYSFFVYGDHPGIQLADDSSGWYNWVAYNTVLQPGRWYLMAATVDRDSPTGGKLYVDGSVVLTFDPRNRMGSLDNNGSLYIGKSDIYSSVPFTGDIDEVELFKRVLGADEIKRIYAAGSNGKCKQAQQPPVDSNRCTPPPPSLVGWWSNDETHVAAGSAIEDLTGNPLKFSPTNAANTGTVHGNVTSVAGEVAGALHFGGTMNDYVGVSNNTDLTIDSGSLSIDAWIKLDEPGYNMVIADKRQEVGAQVRGYCFYVWGGSNLGFQMGDNINSYASFGTATNTLQVGRWHFVAVSVDRRSATGGKLYIDGNLVSTFDPRVRSGSLATTSNFYIGKSDIYACTPFKGSIDEVEVFRRALGADEIKRIYAAGSNGKCKQVQQPPVVSCDSVWLGGHSEECCSYSIGISNVAGTVNSVRYSVQPVQGTNVPSGTIRRIIATPCSIIASVPKDVAGSTSGQLAFDSACTRRGPMQLVIEGSSANAAGQVCVTLVANITTRDGRTIECRRDVCFTCTPVSESRCDELEVTPYLSENVVQSVRLFAIHNMKAPAAPICSVRVAFSPAPHGLTGGALSVDGTAHSWPAASSAGYTMITSQHGLPAQRDVQFALGADNILGWTSTVTITTYHCDGRSCTMTYRWNPMQNKRPDLVRLGDPREEDICASRLTFARWRSPWSQVRTIGLRLHNPAARFIAISPATMPCAPGAPDCNDLLERVVTDGPIAMITLRMHPNIGGNTGGNGVDSNGYKRGDTEYVRPDSLGEAEIALLCRGAFNGRTVADVVYFDADGRELGMDSVVLCGGASGVTELHDPVTGAASVMVRPNPANTAFTVAFTVRDLSPVTVEVFDLLGRRVAEHTAGALASGVHEVLMNAEQLPGGTYFVRVRGGGADGTSRVEVGR